VLGCGIALALLEAGLETGEELVIDARGTELAATVVELPFVRSR
jgi:glycine cleavage system aminomethyltransferase T